MSTFRRGWLDYQSGKDFAAVYETWQPQQQLNYERGRRAAAVATAHNLQCRTWTAFKAKLARPERLAAMREIR